MYMTEVPFPEKVFTSVLYYIYTPSIQPHFLSEIYILFLYMIQENGLALPKKEKCEKSSDMRDYFRSWIYHHKRMSLVGSTNYAPKYYLFDISLQTNTGNIVTDNNDEPL